MSAAIVSEGSIRIHYPLEHVFAFVTTPENDPSWVHSCAWISRTSEGPIRVGSTLAERVRVFGLRVPYVWEVTAFETNRLFTCTSRRGLLPMTIEMAVTLDGAVTEMRERLEIVLPSMFRFASATMKAIASREVQLNLTNLKRVLETKTPVTGDAA